ncbi:MULTISPECIES: hypothetical protein [unclassified Streptomyces]|nr:MULTISPECIES: hypothetical protein [unclassified Streptomyces]MCW5249486.1 hypothetical protein [Streptomyces sp. SHP 1-2]MYU21733.1 hypothetical protein [Streptomyces sp. SID8352]
MTAGTSVFLREPVALGSLPNDTALPGDRFNSPRTFRSHPLRVIAGR